MIGYAGWAPGQLEEEIQAKAWFSIPADKEIIFSKQPEKSGNARWTSDRYLFEPKLSRYIRSPIEPEIS